MANIPIYKLTPTEAVVDDTLIKATPFVTGYTYGGSITPSDTPLTEAVNAFYLASTNGTYTNFGGLVVSALGFIYYKVGDGYSFQAIVVGDGGGGTDEIDGDMLQISWTPTNYTPLSIPTEVDATNQLTAHLYGIDQVFNNSTNWNTAYGWGNHATAGYLTSFTETDPIYTASSWYTTTNNSTDWNTAYTDRNKWDGGVTGLNATTGRASLGANTIGSNIFTSTNPGAVRFLRTNSDNSISWLTAAEFLTAIGAGTSTGTVSSVAMTVPTGLTVSGSPITSSGTLAVSLQSGYQIPTTTALTNAATAYGWGNHATAGYLTSDANYAKLNIANTFTAKQTTSFSSSANYVSEIYNTNALGNGLLVQTSALGTQPIFKAQTASVNDLFRVNADGTIKMGNLPLSTKNYIIGYDPTTKYISYQAAPPTYTAGTGLQLSSDQFSLNFNGLGLISGGSIVDSDLIGIYDASIGSHYKLSMGGLKTFLNIPSAYTLPLAANGTRGGVQIGYTSTANNFALNLASEKGYTALPDASTTVKGIASFNTTNFSTSSGAVSIKSGGVVASSLNGNVISGQIDIGTNNIVDSDIFLISDGSSIRKSAMSRLKDYIGGSGTVTSVTAGNGMTQTGTATINPTLNIVSHAGSAGSIGTINVGADAIGVNLGTTSTTAYRGDLGNAAYTGRIASLTTTGTSGAATFTGNVLNIPNYSTTLGDAAYDNYYINTSQSFSAGVDGYIDIYTIPSDTASTIFAVIDMHIDHGPTTYKHISGHFSSDWAFNAINRQNWVEQYSDYRTSNISLTPELVDNGTTGTFRIKVNSPVTAEHHYVLTVKYLHK